MDFGDGAKRPWFPFYHAEFFSLVNALSAAEGMAFIRLWASYWENNGLPNDDEKLARIAQMSPKQWTKSRAAIYERFGEGWKSKRLDFDREKMIEKSKQNSAKAKLQHSRSKGTAQPQNGRSSVEATPEQGHTHLDQHLQSKSVDIEGTRAREISEAEIADYIFGVKEIWDPTQLEQVFLSASGFYDSASVPSKWRDEHEGLSNYTKLWFARGYRPSLIVGLAKKVADEGGHVKPMSYYDTTLERMHCGAV